MFIGRTYVATHVYGTLMMLEGRTILQGSAVKKRKFKEQHAQLLHFNKATKAMSEKADSPKQNGSIKRKSGKSNNEDGSKIANKVILLPGDSGVPGAAPEFQLVLCRDQQPKPQMPIETRSRSRARKNAEPQPPVDAKRNRKNTSPVLEKIVTDDDALYAGCASRSVKVPAKKPKQSKPKVSMETCGRPKARKNAEPQLPVDAKRSLKDSSHVQEKIVADDDALYAGCASRSYKVPAKTHFRPLNDNEKWQKENCKPNTEITKHRNNERNVPCEGSGSIAGLVQNQVAFKERSQKRKHVSGTTAELNDTIRQILLPRYRTTSNGINAEKLIGMVSYAIVKDYQLKASLKSYSMPLELIAAAFNSCNRHMDLVNVTLRKPEESAKQYSICIGPEQIWGGGSDCADRLIWG
ncbi:hypothetical protein DdX_04178 [Ditylenchus destructor]|uniref:Uncharacterized protein n=1 Tax=Ditylenchus destructor TaxID=166010 RepID=A0AAD4NB29_9BILA|nr:hypothetical protein DdX_04178 [Ditylenchus destructor]